LLGTTVLFLLVDLLDSNRKRLRERALSKKMMNNSLYRDEVVIYTNARASIRTSFRADSVAISSQAAAAEESALHFTL
jgi:hypothetical protein